MRDTVESVDYSYYYLTILVLRKLWFFLPRSRGRITSRVASFEMVHWKKEKDVFDRSNRLINVIGAWCRGNFIGKNGVGKWKKFDTRAGRGGEREREKVYTVGKYIIASTRFNGVCSRHRNERDTGLMKMCRIGRSLSSLPLAILLPFLCSHIPSPAVSFSFSF